MKDSVKFIWLVLVLVGLIWALVSLSACHDDRHTSILPPISHDVPKKCLDDPCLPGCEADDHVFDCPPVGNRCEADLRLSCTCPDPMENEPFCNIW